MIPIYTLSQLQHQKPNIKQPFIIKSSNKNSQTNEQHLHTFANHQPTQPHPIQTFDTHTGVYKHDIQMSPSTFATSIRSGQAKTQDLYWAYYDASSTSLSNTSAAKHFITIEQALGLISNTATPLTVWAGSSGHVEDLHYDDEDNLHMICCGTKRWLLYPPSSFRHLNYVGVYEAWKCLWYGHELPYAGCKGKKKRGGPAMAKQESEQDRRQEERRDEEKDARLLHEEKNGIQVILKVGDALFVPAGWHHEVTTMEPIELDTEIDFVLSFNRFYSTSLFHLLIFVNFWSFYNVARLRMYHAVTKCCCSATKKDEMKED